jgi:quercetin dioxygenase-like cupin family protein
MEIRRFGPGHRRPEGPPGSTGLTGQVIHDDARALISELAFSPRGMIAPHSNPNTTLFIVVSGGGFVQVGDERTRVNHGEAVLWPAGVPHGAYTEGTEMRAIVIELTGPDDAWARGILETGQPVRPGGPAALEAVAGPTPVPTPQSPTATPGEGSLTEPLSHRGYDPSTGEPW